MINKPSTVLVKIKRKESCLSMAQFMYTEGFTGVNGGSDLMCLPDHIFGNTFGVIACIPELNIIQIIDDECNFWVIPLTFVLKFSFIDG